MNQPKPTLSILIVSYNVADYLDKCLASIKQWTHDVTYEVIVVDSGSADDSVARTRERQPWVQLIDAGENIGFTKGNNRALAGAAGEFICYLNPDTELIEDALSECIRYLQQNPSVGVVAPQLLNSDRSVQNSIGRFTRLSSLLSEYFLRRKAEREQLQHPTVPTAIDYGLGACLVVSAELCRQVGGLDERFFANHEETDFCYQLKKLGYLTVYYPAAKVIHYGGKSSTINSATHERWQHENRKGQYLFFQKHSRWLVAQTAKLIILLAMLLRLMILVPWQKLRPSEAKQYKIKYFSATVGYLTSH